jgi:hypothetical protein
MEFIDIVITGAMEAIQKELRQYEIIFIVLSVAFGILVLQSVLFVGWRKAMQTMQEHRAIGRSWL